MGTSLADAPQTTQTPTLPVIRSSPIQSSGDFITNTDWKGVWRDSPVMSAIIRIIVGHRLKLGEYRGRFNRQSASPLKLLDSSEFPRTEPFPSQRDQLFSDLANAIREGRWPVAAQKEMSLSLTISGPV